MNYLGQVSLISLRKNFYKIADDLLKHKEQIERALFNREKNTFQPESNYNII